MDTLADGRSGKIHFESLTPTGYFQLTRGEAREKAVAFGTLIIPAKATGRVPAMVVAHGSAGVSETRETRWAKELVAMGVAAFVVDSFTPRKVRQTATDQGQLSGRQRFGHRMKSHRRCATAAILLLCGSDLASAAGTGTPFQASDDLVLTGAQERLIWQKVSRQDPEEAGAPPGFKASIYAPVPSSIVLRPLPASVTGQIPMVKPYAYTTLGKTLLIVNPIDRKIVDIIRP